MCGINPSGGAIPPCSEMLSVYDSSVRCGYLDGVNSQTTLALRISNQGVEISVQEVVVSVKVDSELCDSIPLDLLYKPSPGVPVKSDRSGFKKNKGKKSEINDEGGVSSVTCRFYSSLVASSLVALQTHLQ